MEPGFFARLALSFVAFFRVLFDARFAADVIALREGRSPPSSPPPLRPVSVPPPVAHVTDGSALVLLSSLQREGRFVDFIQEEIQSYSDAEVGAAVRMVHEGCRKVLHEQMVLEPVRRDPEGATVVLPIGYDASSVRLLGNVAGVPPFTGALRHHGWRVAEVRLPRPNVGTDVRVVMPAEVEL